VICSWFEARLAPLVDGELAPRDRVAVMAHVDGCAHCAGLLEELRVVDALLLDPRAVRLAPDFTRDTMAEVRAMPPPRCERTPFAAYGVSYLVASWLLLAAACVLAPSVLHAGAQTVWSVLRTLFGTLGGIGHVAARLTERVELGGWPAILASVVAVNAALALIAIAIVRRAQPVLVERLRS
jgi:anti-sigma factor RsiW